MQWLEAVKRAGLKPYLTFRSCWGQSAECRTPYPIKRGDTRGYYEDVKEMMEVLVYDKDAHCGARPHCSNNPNLPSVRLWGSWNEPNGKARDSDKAGPDAEEEAPLQAWEAAKLWGETERAASSVGCRAFCTVVAGEFSKDGGEEPPYINNYIRSIKHAEREHHFPTSVKPHVWGMHDYKDLTNVHEKEDPAHRNIEARDFIDTVRSKKAYPTAAIWLSEEGVFLRHPSGSYTRLFKNVERETLAAKDFLRLGEIEHVELADYYQYRLLEEQHEEWDSALLSHYPYYEQSGPEAKEPEDWRPAYCVLVLGKESCVPPRATTKGPVKSAAPPESAEVSVAVDPRGSETRYWVEYGMTTEYGDKTPEQFVDGHAEGEHVVTLTGLASCEHTYHYQVLAENEASDGHVSRGGDRTFTTGCLIGS